MNFPFWTPLFGISSPEVPCIWLSSLTFKFFFTDSQFWDRSIDVFTTISDSNSYHNPGFCVLCFQDFGLVSSTKKIIEPTSVHSI